MTNGNEPINAADPSIHSFSGLTKREYFAAMALQGCLSNINQSYGKPNVNQASMQDAIEREDNFIKDVSLKSVMYADALINALNETT